MTTIIRRFAAPAAFPDSIVLDLEPEFIFPADTLGAYRLKIGYDFSAPNREGAWPSMAQGSTGTRTYTRDSLQIAGGQNVASGQLFPSDQLTIICVVKQNATGQNTFISGVCDGISGAGTAFGLHTSSSGASYTCRYGASTISTPLVDGERWEMVCVAFDRATGDMKLYLPRTNTEVTGTFTEAVSPVGQFQILGESINSSFPGIAEAAWIIAANSYMSKSGLDTMYERIKGSLAVSGVEI